MIGEPSNGGDLAGWSRARDLELSFRRLAKAEAAVALQKAVSESLAREARLNRALAGYYKETADKARYDADHDQLTGLLNKEAWYKQLQERIASNKATGVLVMDMDGFKDVNDRIGHLFGDQLLERRAGHLKQVFRRESDIKAVIARFGGDETAVLFSLDEAGAIIEPPTPGKNSIEPSLTQDSNSVCRW